MTDPSPQDSAYDVLSSGSPRPRRVRVVPVVKGSPYDDGRSEVLLNYRAACPACGGWFPRRMVWRLLPTAVYHCERCDAKVRSNQLWEWSGNAILGSLLAVLGFVVILGWLPVGLGVLGAASVFALSYVIFPYCTPFDLIEPEPDGEYSDDRSVSPNARTGPWPR